MLALSTVQRMRGFCLSRGAEHGATRVDESPGPTAFRHTGVTARFAASLPEISRRGHGDHEQADDLGGTVLGGAHLSLEPAWSCCSAATHSHVDPPMSTTPAAAVSPIQGVDRHDRRDLSVERLADLKMLSAASFVGWDMVVSDYDQVLFLGQRGRIKDHRRGPRVPVARRRRVAHAVDLLRLAAKSSSVGRTGEAHHCTVSLWWQRGVGRARAGVRGAEKVPARVSP